MGIWQYIVNFDDICNNDNDYVQFPTDDDTIYMTCIIIISN